MNIGRSIEQKILRSKMGKGPATLLETDINSHRYLKTLKVLVAAPAGMRVIGLEIEWRHLMVS